MLDPFLRTLSERERNVFIHRYFSLEDMNEISEAFDITVNHVRVILTRTRKKLIYLPFWIISYPYRKQTGKNNALIIPRAITKC
ncbi:MAG: sigma-70 family RNA polymerase sigma factor [Clostridia bacterium]|nr:sigma-70 family RNA polymerase sigma factor [Clostridia bacterium]